MLLQASARRRFGNSGDVCTAEAAFALLKDSFIDSTIHSRGKRINRAEGKTIRRR